ncbi:MAG: tetratricopeptide repeat protein [Spirochaetales bacterium]|nr:tetratricopeptide repeat protein [Spirochaetales bacterium]
MKIVSNQSCPARGRLLLLLLFTVMILSPISAQNSKDGLAAGINEYGNGNYRQAVIQFREVLLNDQARENHDEALFWLSKAYIALNRLTEAEKNLEMFIQSYPDHRFIPEAYYQKGRLLYLQREYQSALQVFQGNLEAYPESPYRANTYYWIGECLYELGHLDRAYSVFAGVVQNYPKSFKIEAAKYRLSLIELQQREEELLKLLTWSHEESLQSLEDFRRREKTYEQALSLYQKKLSDLSEQNLEEQLQETKRELRLAKDQLSSLREKHENLEAQNRELSSQIQQLKSEGPALPATASGEEYGSYENYRRLLELKEKALDLREQYLRLLEREKGARK